MPKRHNLILPTWPILVVMFIYTLFLHYHFGMLATWDTANYHYYLGWTVASKHFYHYGIISGANTFFNPLCDYLNYITYSFSPYLGAFYESIIFTSVLFLIYQIGIRIFVCENPLHTQILAIIACIIGGTTADGVYLDGFYTDIPTSLFILLSLLLAIISLQREVSRWIILFAGVFAGIAVGLKLTNAPYAIAIWVSLLCLSKNKFKVICLCTLGLLIGYFLCEAPFWVMRWQEYKNPIFPMANNIFHSPYFTQKWYSLHPWHWSLWTLYLTLPFRWIYSSPLIRANIRDGRIFLGFLGIFFILYGLIRKNKTATKPEILLLVITFIVSWVLWLAVFRVFRYLVFLNLMSGLLLILGMMQINLISWEKKYRASFALIVVALTLIFSSNYRNDLERPWQGPYVQASIPFKPHKGQIVLIADRRLSFLIPFITQDGAKVANISTQSWSKPAKVWPFPNCRGMRDRKSVRLPTISNVFILQYKPQDPRAKSAFFADLTQGKKYICDNVDNNFLVHPVLCRYVDQ